MPSTLKPCLFKFSPETLAALDKIGGWLDCNRSESLRKLIEDRAGQPPQPKTLSEVFMVPSNFIVGTQETTFNGTKLDGPLPEATNGTVAKVDDLTKLVLKAPKKERAKREINGPKALTDEALAASQARIERGTREAEIKAAVGPGKDYDAGAMACNALNARAATTSLVRTECNAVSKPGGKLL